MPARRAPRRRADPPGGGRTPRRRADVRSAVSRPYRAEGAERDASVRDAKSDHRARDGRGWKYSRQVTPSGRPRARQLPAGTGSLDDPRTANARSIKSRSLRGDSMSRMASSVVISVPLCGLPVDTDERPDARLCDARRAVNGTFVQPRPGPLPYPRPVRCLSRSCVATPGGAARNRRPPARGRQRPAGWRRTA